MSQPFDHTPQIPPEDLPGTRSPRSGHGAASVIPHLHHEAPSGLPRAIPGGDEPDHSASTDTDPA